MKCIKIIIIFFEIAITTSLLTYYLPFTHSNIFAQLNNKLAIPTTTPIKHLIIIFQENTSFDHYFGTYPKADNLKGEPIFNPVNETPKINGLNNSLLTQNPNLFQPHRLNYTDIVTCNPLHDYTDQQKSYNAGKLNKFVEFDGSTQGCSYHNGNQVMDYFDGNILNALWNYAQHFAMSDNFHGNTFGPSTPGHINLISGNTFGATCNNESSINCSSPPTFKRSGVVNSTLIEDLDPRYDICSDKTNTSVSMSGNNIGDLLNKKNVTWGWFSGGFKLPQPTDCDSRSHHTGSNGQIYKDYYPDVEPFQYYLSTSNPKHLSPNSTAEIGHSGLANHQYDLDNFWESLDSNSLPAVSFIKAPTYLQGHPSSSDPITEQKFLVDTISRIQNSPYWKNSAIILTWDDSGGWYDHVMPSIVNPSNDPKNDALFGKYLCNPSQTKNNINQNDKCGYGPRIPILVISPYAKVNFTDHNLTDFASIIKFIEDNWKLGQIGNGSFDSIANSLSNMFNWSKKIS